MSNNRRHDPVYFQEQEKAMIWLTEQGCTPDEIRTMRWGAVDESDKTLTIRKNVTILELDRQSGFVKRDEYEKSFQIPLKGTKCEWFFLKSHIYCSWMFTRERPLSYKRKKSQASLFTPVEIMKICGKAGSDYSINSLTNGNVFGTIELSKLNITKMKTKELGSRAMVVQ